MALLDLATAKQHLNILEVDGVDDDVMLKLDQASAIVLTYLKSQAVAGWSDGTVTVPGNVQAATLLFLGHLYENRGDDMRLDTDLWMAIERLLVGLRDPALA